MSQQDITDLITLWVVIDPIGTLPVFLAITAGMSAAAARRTALRATIAAFVVLLFFVVAGQALLQAMEIDLAAFQIAGSVVLFLFALTMIFGEPKAAAEERDLAISDVDRSIYPLAIPSIASPGAMLAVVSLTDNSKFNIAEQAETVAQMILDSCRDTRPDAAGLVGSSRSSGMPAPASSAGSWGSSSPASP